MTLTVGQELTFDRTFSIEDVQAFSLVSGDHGIQHVAPGGQGRLMVHGLLTATLPTKLGGDLHYIAARMTFEFLRPVFTGDCITTVGRVERVEPGGDRCNLDLSFQCHNQAGKQVLRGSTSGFIPAQHSADFEDDRPA